MIVIIRIIAIINVVIQMMIIMITQKETRPALNLFLYFELKSVFRFLLKVIFQNGISKMADGFLNATSDLRFVIIGFKSL